MEQQPEAAANERRDRRLRAVGLLTPRSFSRSRSRSPSGHDNEDGDDGANGHALSRPAGEGRDSGGEPSLVRETAPARAEELEWARQRARKESEDRRLAEPRKAVIVKLSDDLKKLSRPVFAFDRAGSREAIVAHPGCDGEARDLRCELEYEAQKRVAQYEHLTLGTVWMTPAYLIYLAADTDLPALMKLFYHINPPYGVDLEMHLDIKVVATYFAGPQTMEAARLMELVDDGVGFFQQYATTPEKARFLGLPAVALLRITAMALRNGDISYHSRGSHPRVRIEGGSRYNLTLEMSRFHLGRMMELVRYLPERGFCCFLAGLCTGTTYNQGADRDFTNFLHTFILNVQLIADGKLDEFTFHGCTEHPSSSFGAQGSLRLVRVFDEKIQYVDRKHMATLGEVLWEFFQLLTSRPFTPKYYSAEPIAADSLLGRRLLDLRDARKADGEVEAFFDREAL